MTKVTILARNVERLDQCRRELEQLVSGTANTVIKAMSVDVTDANAIVLAAPQVLQNHEQKPTRVYLFCCVGEAIPGKFSDLSPSVIETQISSNYLSIIFTIHTFLPYLEKGTIVITSSAAGQIGVVGFSSYSSAKFALAGLAESLHMELLHKPDLHIQVVFLLTLIHPALQKKTN
jgi:3-dehydrosphinganine reductase